MSPEIKNIEVLSEWLEFKLETKLINPPIIKLKVSPIYSIAAVDHVDEKGEVKSLTKLIVDEVLAATKEWDLTLDGKPVPVDDESKRRCLLPLLGIKIKRKESLLGLALFTYASNLENFVKN